MQPASGSCKRPSPGTSPQMPQAMAPVQQQQQQQQQQPAPAYPAYSPRQDPQQPQPDFNQDFLQAFAQDPSFFDASLNDGHNFTAYSQNATQTSTYGTSLGVPASTDLVRRSRGQIMAPVNAAQQEQWNGKGRSSIGVQQQQRQQAGEEDEMSLTVKVELAKRDAQGKRKQIPPFVQKLSSFLDSNNTDLIRWSDDGKSFIVLDEDEFARTLIPELFKHNNYASFVRQLNMYGFHKTVNITDGSLRQSEKARKGNKPPSMYSHPYFRKNRPDLLWLIQKPTTKSSAKRKRDGNPKDNYESDDERQYSPGPDGRPQELGTAGVGQDLTTLPRNELSAVRSELSKLQQQQRFISKMITQLKEQNDQFYRQATAFQALHDRHENSINAILTFLATFYNRSLDGTGAANLVNMFNQQNNHQQQQGSVVEEFNDGPSDSSSQLQRYVKRPQLLLGAPSPAIQSLPPNPQRAPSSVRHSVSPPNALSERDSASAAPDRSRFRTPATASPVPKTEAQTPQRQSIPESDQMMSLINSVNATNASTPNATAPAFDFSSALDHFQNADGNAPLTAQQRDNVLALMANQHAEVGNNNALVSPTPPAMPDLNQFKETQQQLEMLSNMQRQQDDRVQELNRRLQPLSPTGSIPGLAYGSDENPFDYTGGPGDFDPDNYFDFGNSAANDAEINFDFNVPPPGDDNDIFRGYGPSEIAAQGANGNELSDGAEMFGTSIDPADGKLAPQTDGHRVESLSSEATSPAGTSEEVGTPNKRQRRRQS